MQFGTPPQTFNMVLDSGSGTVLFLFFAIHFGEFSIKSVKSHAVLAHNLDNFSGFMGAMEGS